MAELIKIYEYQLPRNRVYLVAGSVGILAGWLNSYLDLDFSLRPELFLWLAAALVVTIVLHEGVHGAVARVLGYRPEFGLKLPLVYITFHHRIPRGHFILIALAPLVVLNVLFGALYASDTLKLFADFCLIINTLGAAGDVWITLKLLRVRKGTLIQDTKTGIEVWAEIQGSM